FSTIYTPQAILPTLQQVFQLSMSETNLLLFSMLFVLMVATPFYIPIIKRYDKKKIMSFSIFFLFLSVLLSALADNYYLLLFSRVLQGIFLPGFTAVMLSYVQEIYPENRRGLGIGIYMAATSFGAVLGRLLAGWITYIYSWDIAFFVFASLLLVALLALLFGLPSTKIDNTKTKQIRSDKSIFYCFFQLEIISLLFIPMVVFFSFMSITTFIPYRLHNIPFGFNESQLGNIFLILLVGVVVSPIAGKYSDILGRVKIMFIGIFSLIIGMILTTTDLNSVIIIGIGFVTIGMFSVQSVAPAYLGDLVPHDKGHILLLYQIFFYFGGAMGTLVPTVVWSYYNYFGVIVLCLGVVILAILPLIYLTFTKKYNKYEETNILP
ncbi:MAG TPA: MFS transporter, partial [Campylobacterales bacterium]|nr:MFS transporter [Campylobacterales bacterium]